MSEQNSRANRRFEVVGELYYRATGRLRPGKSEAPGSGRDSGDRENQDRFESWLANAALTDALTRMMVLEDQLDANPGRSRERIMSTVTGRMNASLETFANLAKIASRPLIQFDYKTGPVSPESIEMNGRTVTVISRVEHEFVWRLVEDQSNALGFEQPRMVAVEFDNVGPSLFWSF